MPPRRDSLVPVDLVEADDPDPQEPAAPTRRRPRWWLWAVPLAAVALVAGTQLVIDARIRAADARVAALPGAVDPIGDSLDILWRADASMVPLASGLVAHDALHGVIVADDGSVSYDAVDLGTGDQLWSTPLHGPHAALTDPMSSGGTACHSPTLPGTEPDRVVCLVTDSVQRYSETGQDESLPPTESHVVVLDLADGHVLVDRPLPPVTSLAVLPGLVATAVVDDQRHVVVVATDPITGEELWRYLDVTPFRGVVSTDTTYIYGIADMVVMFNQSGGPLMLSADGGRVELDDRAMAWGTSSAGWLTFELPDPDGREQQETVVFRPGAEPLDVAGRLLDKVVDDGSVPGLEVSSGSATYGWDSRTGERLWTADVSAAASWQETVLVIDETVFLTTPEDVVALDARTGETRWTFAKLQGSYTGELLTDGAHLLLVEAPADRIGTGYVTVMDRRDGTFVRRVALPDGTVFAFQAGRRLIDADDRGVVRIG